MEHTRLWHMPRDSWCCPPVTSDYKTTAFFENVTEPSQDDTEEDSSYTYCLCCGEVVPENTGGAYNRTQHLEEKHNFHKNTTCEKFCRLDLFTLHLANMHGVQTEFVGNLAEICREEDRSPIFKLGQHSYLLKGRSS
jgi:hypothetical protein